MKMSACATSAHCIGAAAEQIAMGKQDIVFAGVAVLAFGPELHIDELLAMMAGLILAANLIVGSGLALYDLLKGVTRNDAID